MILLLGAIGWSLFAFGAIVHVMHFGRFKELMSLHFRHAASIALGVILLEATLAAAIPVAFAAGQTAVLTVACMLAGVLGAAFAAWVGRLLVTGSHLPCACSFSAEPASIWSLFRSLATLLVIAFAFADHAGAATNLATILAGGALGIAVFTLPDALAWPASSQRLREELAV
jgi:hypothetical protein